MQNCYQNLPKLNGVYSKNNPPTTKNDAYVINLVEYKSIGTHRIAMYVIGDVIHLTAL